MYDAAYKVLADFIYTHIPSINSIFYSFGVGKIREIMYSSFRLLS